MKKKIIISICVIAVLVVSAIYIYPQIKSNLKQENAVIEPTYINAEIISNVKEKEYNYVTVLKLENGETVELKTPEGITPDEHKEKSICLDGRKMIFATIKPVKK